MRVISGIAHGRKLKSPENLDVRPTISRIKEAIFNSIANKIKGSIFLDLYSGSGAIGIEALSRGAKKCFFIEHNKKCVDLIKHNLSVTKLMENAEVIYADTCFALEKLFEQKIFFDLVFMDPPYHKNLVSKTLVDIGKFNILAPNAVVICETCSDDYIVQSDVFDFFKTKKYNNVMISYARKR